MIEFKLVEVLNEKGVKNHRQFLEKHCNIHRLTVKGLLSGTNTRIDFSTLDKICKGLDCQPGDLFEYTPD